MTRASWEVLEEAHRALRGAVAGVRDGGWHAPTPCEGWDVTQVLQHAAGDQLGYAATGGPGPAYADPATALLNFSAAGPTGHRDWRRAAGAASSRTNVPEVSRSGRRRTAETRTFLLSRKVPAGVTLGAEGR